MNQCVSAPSPAGKRRVWLFLSLLLPAMVTEVAQSTAPPMKGAEDAIPLAGRGESHPYLRFVGPPPLRFQEALPPPDLTVRPPAGGPPKVSVKTGPDLVQTPIPEGHAAAPVAVTGSAGKPEAAAAGSTPVKPPIPKGPPPLLPDDAGARVRPEDFLPFFQFPGGKAADVRNVPVPPAPGMLPPSSASYQQQ